MTRRPRRRKASAEECTQALRRAVRLFPAPDCLARALAAQALLRRSGRVPALRLGVHRRADGTLAAHAWTDCDGMSVTGGPEAAEYIPLVGPGLP